MPIRSYECINGHKFERINAPSSVRCPQCSAKARAKEWETPARRNPDRGIQTKM
jgi:DNA-directed RNA polymerase subunit RPC12/RpoP